MRKSVIGIGVAIVLAGSSAIATSVAAQATDEPGSASSDVVASPQVQAQVELVTAKGSGCPSGIPGARATYRDGIEISFDTMQSVRSRGATDVTDLQDNCQINVKVAVPDGVTYAVSAVKAQGRATLAEGATAKIIQNIYVQGVSETTYLDKEINGPVNSGLDLSGSVPASAQSFAPCNADRNLNVNTRVVLRGSGSALSNSANEVSIVGGMKISLAFKSC